VLSGWCWLKRGIVYLPKVEKPWERVEGFPAPKPVRRGAGSDDRGW